MRSNKDDALESINSIMQNFMSTLDYSKVETNQSISDVWQQIVPKQFKEKTKTLNKTTDGTLFVACENSLISNELVMQKQEILSKLPQNLSITNIVFSHKAWRD